MGTKAAEIYEVNRLNPAEIYRYVQGHFGERAEVRVDGRERERERARERLIEGEREGER